MGLWYPCADELLGRRPETTTSASSLRIDGPASHEPRSSRIPAPPRPTPPREHPTTQAPPAPSCSMSPRHVTITPARTWKSPSLRTRPPTLPASGPWQPLVWFCLSRILRERNHRAPGASLLDSLAARTAGAVASVCGPFLFGPPCGRTAIPRAADGGPGPSGVILDAAVRNAQELVFLPTQGFPSSRVDSWEQSHRAQRVRPDHVPDAVFDFSALDNPVKK